MSVQNVTGPLPQSIADTKASRFQLAELMWRAGVSEDTIVHYTNPRPPHGDGKGCTAISDFAGLYKEENYADKVEAEVKKITAHADDDLEISRVRVAWTLARTEVQRALRRRSEGSGADGNPDWDTPLTAPEEAERSDAFDRAYDKVVFESEWQPLKSLVGRTWREFGSQNRAVSTIRLEKVRSEADLAGVRTKQPKKTPLGDGYSITKDGEEDERMLPAVKIGNVISFLKCIQLMTNLWAWCGAALVDSKTEVEPGTSTPQKVRQCHLSICLRYFSFVMERLLQHPGPLAEKLLWAYDRDRQTRNKARTLFQQGWPWGEAMVQAFTKDLALEWRVTGVGITNRTPTIVKEDSDDEGDEQAKGTGSGGPGGGKSAAARKKLAVTSKRKRQAEKRSSKACPDYNGKGCEKNAKNCPMGCRMCVPSVAYMATPRTSARQSVDGPAPRANMGLGPGGFLIRSASWMAVESRLRMLTRTPTHNPVSRSERQL